MRRTGPARLLWVLGVTGVLAAAFGLRTCGAGQPRLASFNIEEYPKSARQVDEAFALIAGLNAEIVAVQEITDPAGFEREAKARLGGSWRFLHDRGGNTHHLGMLYDGDAVKMLSTRVYRETELGGAGKPTLEVRFERGGRRLRVLTVHLKAGDEGLPLRLVQLGVLQPILRAAVASGDEVALLGDFNATTVADRAAIDALAVSTGLHWQSADLGCTCYWERPGSCRADPLDHVLTTGKANVVALGPCAKSCDFGASCPEYVHAVSDHCPVVVDLAAFP